jgi:hypothetical protein
MSPFFISGVVFAQDFPSSIRVSEADEYALMLHSYISHHARFRYKLRGDTVQLLCIVFQNITGEQTDGTVFLAVDHLRNSDRGTSRGVVTFGSHNLVIVGSYSTKMN